MKNTAKKNGRDGSSKTKPTASEGLRQLFVDGLKDIYSAEQTLTKAIPKMIDQATSEDLIDALTNHLKETEEQVTRLEKIFSSIDEEAQPKKCQAILGLTKEAEEIMDEAEEGVVRDAGIILAAQKVEHYEIATYGTLRAFADILGEQEAVSLLEETLEEEKQADEKLSEIASSINIEAADANYTNEDSDVAVKTKRK
jgi:ferritin-like metal-binding protein YciE